MSRLDEKRDLVTSRGTLQYTTVDLINEVAKYPVLWNRLHPDFKEGKAKDEVWDEISRVFVPFYDDIDEDEKLTIAEILKARWKNCVQGVMKSVSLKQKNDRLFRPFKYAREMKFYLEARGINFSDIYDVEKIVGIDETIIKMEEMEEAEHTDEDVTHKYTPKNKKAKTVNTSATYRSPRLREKQTVMDKNLAEQKSISENSQHVQQINRTPTSINTSIGYSLENTSNTSDVVIDAAAEDSYEEDHTNNCLAPQINHSVNMNQFNQPKSLINESDAADQAFFESIKPALKKMSETQKLDFQIDVLQILKTFRTN